HRPDRGALRSRRHGALRERGRRWSGPDLHETGYGRPWTLQHERGVWCSEHTARVVGLGTRSRLVLRQLRGPWAALEGEHLDEWGRGRIQLLRRCHGALGG